MSKEKSSLIDRLVNLVFLAVMGLARQLPYPQRVRAMGWVFAMILAPVLGWRKRIRQNLSLACPELTKDELAALVRRVPDNAGRALAEIYSGDEFADRIRRADPLTGPGLVSLEAAFAEGRSVIIACAHFGNYDAMRTALAARGWPVGALYRPMNNEAFNKHYVPTIAAIAEPLFPRGRGGLAAMLRFLKGGGWLALGFDQYDQQAPELRFFGLPSRTVLTPAELALRYDALILPVHGLRNPDGLTFSVQVGAPVPHGEAADMMQTLNDGLEALVRQHMDQWFWVHRRWK